MKEIKCPKCGEVFIVDESDYNAIVKQIRDNEFKNEVNERIKIELINKVNEFEIKKKDMEANNAKVIADLTRQIELLTNKLENYENEKKLAISDANNKSKDLLNSKDLEIIRLKDQIKNIEDSVKNEVEKAINDKVIQIKDLENEIANEDVYIKMKKTYESILELSKDDDIDDDNFEKLDRTLVMASHELSKLKITDLEKGQELIKLLYKACYHVIKLEICKYGYSKLLVKINNLDQGCEFLNGVIKEDLDSFDLEDKSNGDIKKRLDELSKNGLDSSLCDLELIIRITIRDCPSLRIKINDVKIEVERNLDEVELSKIIKGCVYATRSK